MEKNLELFQICFAIAFKSTQGVADFCLLTYEDLRQNCWIVFAGAKECTNKNTYTAYITRRLIWAIKDYRSKILKTRIEWVDGKQKSVDRRPHISLDNEEEIIEFRSTEDSDYSGSDLIIEDVMSNGIFNDCNHGPPNQREKVYFKLSFLDDLSDKEIADHQGVSIQRISYIKKKVYSKLRSRYAETAKI